MWLVNKFTRSSNWMHGTFLTFLYTEFVLLRFFWSENCGLKMKREMLSKFTVFTLWQHIFMLHISQQNVKHVSEFVICSTWMAKVPQFFTVLWHARIESQPKMNLNVCDVIVSGIAVGISRVAHFSESDFENTGAMNFYVHILICVMLSCMQAEYVSKQIPFWAFFNDSQDTFKYDFHYIDWMCDSFQPQATLWMLLEKGRIFNIS